MESDVSHELGTGDWVRSIMNAVGACTVARRRRPGGARPRSPHAARGAGEEITETKGVPCAKELKL